MIELSTVLNALKIIWGLVGCMAGLYLIVGLAVIAIAGTMNVFGGKKRERE